MRVELASPYGHLRRGEGACMLFIANGARGRHALLDGEANGHEVGDGRNVIFDGMAGVCVNVPTHWLKEIK